MCRIKEVKNILIIRLSSLGDVLLTTPVIRALKAEYPGSSLYFLVKKEYSDAVKFHPDLSKIIEYDNDRLDSIISEIKTANINYVVDLQNNFRSRKVVKLLGVETVKYIKPSLKKFLLSRFGIDLYKKILSIPEMYAANIPGITLDEKGPDFYLSESGEISSSQEKRIIGICPGAKHFTKRWPANYFIELGNKLVDNGFKVIILGGRDDVDLCNNIAANIHGSINPEHENNLFNIAADIKNCKLVFCNDSGLMHLATALKVPVITFFGSSVRQFGFAPYKSQNSILENNSLSCRPCSHIGKEKCPKKHFDCMKTITPAGAYKEFGKIIREI